MKVQKLSFSFGVALAGFVLTATAFAGVLRATDASVLQSYEKIQLALAADSVKTIPENAAAIAKAVQSDPDKRIPGDVAKLADKLAKDTDLKTARDDFKNLSEAVISYLEKSDIKGAGYEQNYCPMVKANWLQKG